MAGRGRPREFDRKEALWQAMLLFWERGYEATTISDLTGAMGINKPSFYAAFTGKEELFKEVLDLYREVENTPVQKILHETPTACAAIDAALRAYSRSYTSPGKPPGCLIVLASLLGMPENGDIRQALRNSRGKNEDGLCARIERGKAEGDVPADADARAMAIFYATVIQGLSIQARDGASLEKLEKAVDGAMASWDVLTRPA
jgi:AcrR family transcriptional regulator